MICSLPKCKKPIDKYGVCQFHKAWCYMSDDANFNEKIQEYQILMGKLHEENDCLKNKGINISDIEKCWENGDLSNRVLKLPEHFKSAVNLIEEMDKIKKELLQKFDPKLVENCIMRALHSSSNNKCGCVCCRLRPKK